PTRRAVKNLRPIPASVRRHAGCCGQPGGRERAADLAMESVADLDVRQRRQARLNECQREWRGFKDEIARVRAQLEASRRQYEASRDSSAPVEQQMRDSQLLEATIRQYEAKLAELTRKGGRILERAPQFSEADRSGELQSLRIDWEELRVRVTERRQELHRIQTSQAQYEQMLHSWAEYLETAESKLAEASLTAADSADVRRQQQQHRAFFEGLETHEATLEQGDFGSASLRPREAARHSVQHARLGQVARAVKLAAAQRTNQMETLAQDWAELDDRLAQLDAWVAGAADRLAEIRSQPPAADEAAEERRLSGLQELASSLRGRRSAVFQLVDRGRLLLGWVACPRLETALSDLAERWVQLTDSVEDQLSVAEDRRRVGEEFANTWLIDCLQRAEVELESATAASGAAAAEEASLEGVRAGLERLCTVAQLLESRQRERRLLQDLAAGSPSALASTTSRRRRAEEVEAAWVGLERRWRALETRLQRRERELTPSHEALLGLRDWLSGFESRLASASRRTLHSRAETEALAAEFQVRLRWLAFAPSRAVHRSPTLAFVRESFAELRLAQSDAREFESLTRLGADFDRASDSVASIATSLEAFARRWAAVDDRGSALTARLNELKARVAGLGEIGHEEGARFAAREAEATAADLAALEPQLAALETEARSLLTEEAGASGCLGCDSLIVNPQCMRELLQRLAQELALVNNQLTQVKSSALANALA
uniref:PH domain-containing protein n=1 Tax=Macrostomum lignano TaxID=282301 RepID=A0A1I8JNU9_9PLAT